LWPCGPDHVFSAEQGALKFRYRIKLFLLVQHINSFPSGAASFVFPSVPHHFVLIRLSNTAVIVMYRVVYAGFFATYVFIEKN
jgi:hypothetical protein